MLTWVLGVCAASVSVGAGAQGSPPLHVAPRAGRWGEKIDGRWSGGAHAPGGWAAYRRPVRGYGLPVYWNDSRFRVIDPRAYGLTEPPPGYHWSRYYDDAVLVDGRGSVRDAVYGLDWDQLDRGRYGDEVMTYPADRVYPDHGRREDGSKRR